MKNNKKVNQNNEQNKYDFVESKIINYSKIQFDSANRSINIARATIKDAWLIKVYKDKKEQLNNPYSQLIDMMGWYINECKKEYAKYLKEHHLKLNKEEKKVLNEAKTQEDKNKPVKITHIKQIKAIK